MSHKEAEQYLIYYFEKIHTSATETELNVFINKCTGTWSGNKTPEQYLRVEITYNTQKYTLEQIRKAIKFAREHLTEHFKKTYSPLYYHHMEYIY